MIGTYRRVEPRPAGPSCTLASPAGPGPHPAYAVVAPAFVGVCQSDLRELRGERHLRRDFGHEIVGRVVETRPHGLIGPGDVVCLDPHVPVTRTSGFAEYVELAGTPQAVRAALIDLPCPAPEPLGVFTEPLACACHCLSRLAAETQALGLADDEPVLIVGAGMAATLMALALRERGVPVTVANRGRGRLEFLRRRGVLPGVPMAAFEEPPARPHRRVIVATATARPDVMEWALRNTAPGGLLLLYAGTSPGDRCAGVDLDALRRRQARAALTTGAGTVVLAGSHGADRADFTAAIDLLWAPASRLGHRVRRTIDRRFPLRDAPAELVTAARTGLVGKHLVITAPPVLESR